MERPKGTAVHRWRCVAAGWLASWIMAAGVPGQEPASKDAAKAPTEPAKAAARTFEGLKLPPGAIIVVTDKPADALRNVNAVILTPDEYQKLVEALEQTRRNAELQKPELPSTCRLSGRVENRGGSEVVKLQAQYEFRTTAAHATVVLGLQNARLTAATLDNDRPAVVVPTKEDDGYALLVDAPGDHRALIDLEIPLAARGPKGLERGFELGLTGAAITTLQRLEGPAGATRARVAGRNLPVRLLTPAENSGPAVVLGPTQRLDVSWDVPVLASGDQALVAAEARVEVRIDDKTLTTRNRLALRVLRGTVGIWRVSAPVTAEVTVEGPAGTDGSVQVEKPADAMNPVWTIRRDRGGDDLPIEIVSKTVWNPAAPVPLAVSSVLDAVQQRGTLTIAAPANLRLSFRPRGELFRRENPDEFAREAIFTYGSLPPSGVLLDIDVQLLKGDIEVQVAHQLTLVERGWRWQGKFDIRPVRTELASLEIDAPIELQELHATSAEIVESVSPVSGASTGRKRYRVQFAEARRRPFAITLEGLVASPASGGAASVPLPRPVGILDRGGQLSVAVPSGLEVRGAFREWDRDRPSEWERPLEPSARGGGGLTVTLDRQPSRVDLVWRAPRSDAAIKSVVEIEFHDRQSLVRQRWRIPAGADSARAFVAHAPANLLGRLRATSGGTLAPGTPGEWLIQLASATGTEHELAVGYSFPLSPVKPGAPMDIPLIWLDPFPRVETEVRVWTEFAGTRAIPPVSSEGPWTELPPAISSDHSSLPILTLLGTGSGLPLRLRIDESIRGTTPLAVIERVLGQVVEDDDRDQAYRVRYRLPARLTDWLDIELPAPPAAIQFSARLDGKKLSWPAPESDNTARRMVRLRLETANNDGAHSLELTYLLAPGRADVPSSPRWQFQLWPPIVRNHVEIGPTRWQIERSAGDLMITGDGFAAAERWRWQRGLLTATPAWGRGDLERWLAGTEAPTIQEVDTSLFGARSLVGRQITPGPIRFVTVPRPLALLIGSLAAVGVGLAAGRWGGHRSWFIAVVLVGAVAIWATVAWPRIMAQVLAACQPGLVVLAGVMAVRWMMQHRYRRRLLFLPGFQRTPPAGSSFVRPAEAPRPNVEPSTIDAPTPS